MIEVERKYLGVNLAELGKRLNKLGWQHKSSCFESNYILDTNYDDLFKQDRLLRLRETVDQNHCRGCVLTYKQPATRTERNERIDQNLQKILDARGTKIREEWELPVSDRNAMLRIFSNLGYVIRTRYEKLRETWVSCPLLLSGSSISESVIVCLDYLPFGEFAEIEGMEAAITEAESLLGLDKMKKSSTNYHKLYQAWLEENFLPKENPCVFDPETKREALRRIGLAPSDLQEDVARED